MKTHEVKTRLRAMEPEDLDMLYQIENDTESWNVGATNVPYSRYLLHEYMASATGDIYTDKQVRLIIENEAGEAIGLADLTNFDPRHHRAEVGLIIERPRRLQGYAESAMRRLHHYARHTLHLHQVYAVISTSNAAALALFRKLGYHESAHLDDWLFDGEGYWAVVVCQLTL